MKYNLGIILLEIGIFMMTNLAFKTRYTRKEYQKYLINNYFVLIKCVSEIN